jgi:methyl-accepting chemotaxis protein
MFGSRKTEKKADAATYRDAVEAARSVCEAAAQGNLEARITNTDDFGPLKGFLVSINDMLDQVDAYVRESAASLQYASQRKYFRPFLLRGTRGEFRRGAEVINTAREAMKRRHELTEDFQSTVSSVVGIVGDAAARLEETANSVATQAETAYEQSASVVSVSDRAAANSESVATTTEELTGSIGDISRQTEECMAAVREVTDQMVRASEAAVELREAATRIEQVASFVKDVAGQTNLLALNATIEAAHAGEAGQGFAVVAGEVKALATQVSNATADIEKQVEAINSAGGRTADSITSIETRIKRVDDVTTLIATAMRQQAESASAISNSVQETATGAKEISGSVSSISEASEQTGVAAKTVLSASQDLAREADSMKEKVADFLEKIAAA